jgi:hypothetical protein
LPESPARPDRKQAYQYRQCRLVARGAAAPSKIEIYTLFWPDELAESAAF